MGNMYCDGATMTMGDGLGYDDFPMEVKFEINMKHGKPRDKGDIENMFNAGQGRIYTSASSGADILNLAGIDVQTYGNVKAGNNNFQGTQGNQGFSESGTIPAPTRGASLEQLEDDLIDNLKTGAIAATEKSEEYISNLASLIIDS